MLRISTTVMYIKRSFLIGVYSWIQIISDPGCLVFMTCCSLIWLGAEDEVACQFQISGQTWILYFSYQTSSRFGKVVLSPAHTMWRTPAICWKGGGSCYEKLPVWNPAYERLFWLTSAAADDVCWEHRTTETRLDSSTAKEKKNGLKKSRQGQTASLCLSLLSEPLELVQHFYLPDWDSDAQQQHDLRVNWESYITQTLSTKACFCTSPSYYL